MHITYDATYLNHNDRLFCFPSPKILTKVFACPCLVKMLSGFYWGCVLPSRRPEKKQFVHAAQRKTATITPITLSLELVYVNNICRDWSFRVTKNMMNLRRGSICGLIPRPPIIGTLRLEVKNIARALKGLLHVVNHLHWLKV